jgi:hypothetical protein
MCWSCLWIMLDNQDAFQCFSMFFNANDLDYIFLYLQDLKKLFNLQRFHMCFHMCTCINKKMDSLSI